jgi:hypothetical protein
MRKYYLVLASCVFAISLSAQKVIPSLGGISSSNTSQMQITFTMGESFVPTLTAGENMITQGFQQPDNTLYLSLQRSNSDKLEAYAEKGTAKVVWETIPTIETTAFALERLNNETGIFETLETRQVNALKATLFKHDFTDIDPQDGDNIYRIKQIVPNQLSSISENRKLNFNGAEKVTLFPNPAVAFVNLDLSSYVGKDAIVSIFSYSGQLVLQQKIDKINELPVKILLNTIETGQYQMRIKVTDKKSSIVKPLIIVR